MLRIVRAMSAGVRWQSWGSRSSPDGDEKLWLRTRGLPSGSRSRSVAPNHVHAATTDARRDRPRGRGVREIAGASLRSISVKTGFPDSARDNGRDFPTASCSMKAWSASKRCSRPRSSRSHHASSNGMTASSGVVTELAFSIARKRGKASSVRPKKKLPDDCRVLMPPLVAHSLS